MASFTKQAIRESFLRLLDEYPLRDITVKMIVETCGINRKSFYYHYQDIPALLEEIVMEGMDEAMAEYRSYHSLEECLDSILHQLLEKKKPMWNIYRSVNRDVFETGLMKLCDYVTRSYMTQLAAAYPICADDQELLTGFYRDECFGLIMGWMMRGMQEDVLPSLHRLCALRRGMAEEICAGSARNGASHSRRGNRKAGIYVIPVHPKWAVSANRAEAFSI